MMCFDVTCDMFIHRVHALCATLTWLPRLYTPIILLEGQTWGPSTTESSQQQQQCDMMCLRWP
jgi:hypothetical protein